jgi:hypothetical protein
MQSAMLQRPTARIGSSLSVDDQSHSDVAIRGGDERLECQFVEGHSGDQFHMSHVPARAFQERCAIWQTSTVKEADVDVGGKDADVGKRRVANASGGQAVVHEFSNVRSAAAHTGKPGLRQSTQVIWLRREPGRNRRIAFDSLSESQKCRHDKEPATLR